MQTTTIIQVRKAPSRPGYLCEYRECYPPQWAYGLSKRLAIVAWFENYGAACGNDHFMVIDETIEEKSPELDEKVIKVNFN